MRYRRISFTKIKVKSYSEFKKDEQEIRTMSNDVSTIWVCRECQMTLAFLSDVADHKQTSGHKKIVEYELDTYQKKINLDARNDLDWQEKNR